MSVQISLPDTSMVRPTFAARSSAHLQIMRLDHSLKNIFVIPGIVVTPRVHVGSPRLAHPKDAADFQMEVIQELPDAGV